MSRSTSPLSAVTDWCICTFKKEPPGRGGEGHRSQGLSIMPGRAMNTQAGRPATDAEQGGQRVAGPDSPDPMLRGRPGNVVEQPETRRSGPETRRGGLRNRLEIDHPALVLDRHAAAEMQAFQSQKWCAGGDLWPLCRANAILGNCSREDVEFIFLAKVADIPRDVEDRQPE